MRTSFRTIVLALVAWTCVACRWHAASSEEASVGNVVSQAELSASGAPSLYDALQRTRRTYFASRGVGSISNQPADAILVFRDGALMGTVEVLRTLQPSDVRLVRHLSAMETYQKYGRVVSTGGLEIELASR